MLFSLDFVLAMNSVDLYLSPVLQFVCSVGLLYVPALLALKQRGYLIPDI